MTGFSSTREISVSPARNGAVRELDSWAEQYATPVFVRFVSDQKLSEKNWYEAFQALLQSPPLVQLVPRFAEPFAPKHFEIVDPTRMARAMGKEKFVCTYVEMDMLDKKPKVRCATQRLVYGPSTHIAPSGRRIPLVIEGSKILDGLVSLYCQSYQPPPGTVAALVNVRHERVQVAILNGDSLLFSQSISPPSEWRDSAPSHTSFGYRMPIFVSGGKHFSTGTKYVANQIEHLIDFFRKSPNGQRIDTVYLAGEPYVSEGVGKALHQHVGIMVQPFDVKDIMQNERWGFSESRCETAGRRLAPEIGLALQHCVELRRKAFVGLGFTKNTKDIS